MIPFVCFFGTVLCGAVVLSASAEEPSRLPVREVTVFKDGYSFVSREGKLSVKPDGTAVLDELPVPVLGTFWAYSRDKSAPLRAVTTGRVTVQTTRSAANIRELLEANVGKAVAIRESRPGTPLYNATILGIRDGSLVLLKTAEGVRLVTLVSIAEVTLVGENPKLTIADSTTTPCMTMSFGGERRSGTADVGIMYLQSGLRWIPGYKIVLDEAKNTARISLQATLVNDLADLDNVTAQLVIGAPQWDYKDTADPMVLSETLAQLYAQNGQLNQGQFSNAIQSQFANTSRAADKMTIYKASASLDTRGDAGGMEATPTVARGESKEDFFVFTVKNVRLRRGERMVIPVAEFSLAYSDVYKLELAPAPPREWQQAYYNGSTSQLPPELAALLSAPRVKHYLRFCNTSPYPLSTAPVLLFSGERVLAQGTMTYTPKKGEVDIPLTAASNITVKHSDKETGRVPDIKKWNGYSFEQVDLAGTIFIANYGAKPAALEVSRYVLGAVTRVSADGTADALDLFSGMDSVPRWWSSYNLPNDLGRYNGLGRATWKSVVPAGKRAELSYSWRYLWR